MRLLLLFVLFTVYSMKMLRLSNIVGKVIVWPT